MTTKKVTHATSTAIPSGIKAARQVGSDLVLAKSEGAIVFRAGDREELVRIELILRCRFIDTMISEFYHDNGHVIFQLRVKSSDRVEAEAIVDGLQKDQGGFVLCLVPAMRRRVTAVTSPALFFLGGLFLGSFAFVDAVDLPIELSIGLWAIALPGAFLAFESYRREFVEHRDTRGLCSRCKSVIRFREKECSVCKGEIAGDSLQDKSFFALRNET